jgi:RimJ/RimL family protein N-acetyltransferase
MSRVVLPGTPLLDGPTALRAWRDSDVDGLVRACQDPEISRWTRVPYPYGETDAHMYLLQRYEAIGAGHTAPFAIVARADPDHGLLGSMSLMRISWEHRRAEVGYWLAREARGHGHATRGVGLIAHWGFSTLGLERLDLFAATGNRASQLVAERAGFTREGTLRSYMSATGGRQDMVAYGLLVSDRQAH